MKNILLLSDTHSHLDDRILNYVHQADEIWHAGDIGTVAVSDTLEKIKPLRAVYGNIDGQELRNIHPKTLEFSCEDVAVMITHIGGYPGRYVPKVRKLIDKKKPALFISGHSHILKVMNDSKRNLLHMNPGACGKSGFHKIRTMLRFRLQEGKIENLEVIELGLRGELT